MSSQSETASNAQAHYERLLAGVYGWMIGERAAAIENGRKQLRAAGIGEAKQGQRALDLGAGVGVHAIPLAEMGYEVTAVDTSEALLGELRAARGDVRIVHADLLRAGEVVKGPFDVIVCMGDTLTHLASLVEVGRAISAAAGLLGEGGRFVSTFRDYVSAERRGTERFLLVRGDEGRVMTCCLDFEPSHVVVTDIVHERSGGAWSMRASEYRKVRLARAWVEERLVESGLTLESVEALPGWVMVAASRRAR